MKNIILNIIGLGSIEQIKYLYNVLNEYNETNTDLLDRSFMTDVISCVFFDSEDTVKEDIIRDFFAKFPEDKILFESTHSIEEYIVIHKRRFDKK